MLVRQFHLPFVLQFENGTGLKQYGLSSVKKNEFRVKQFGLSSVKKNEVFRVKQYGLSSVKKNVLGDAGIGKIVIARGWTDSEFEVGSRVRKSRPRNRRPRNGRDFYFSVETVEKPRNPMQV